MRQLLSQYTLKLNENIYLKNPSESEVGLKIISQGIELIAEIGIEQFTFRKLGQRIGSPESTIYRYFENKHKLLVYLISYYWCWLEYRLVFAMANIDSPEERLNRALEVITSDIEEDSNFSHINEVALHRIVISESAKVYLTKEVDAENKAGLFQVYQNLLERLTNIIHEINPKYAHPHTLMSMVIEGVHQQKYFAEHLPGLTELTTERTARDFFVGLVFASIKA